MYCVKDFYEVKKYFSVNLVSMDLFKRKRSWLHFMNTTSHIQLRYRVSDSTKCLYVYRG